MIKNVIVFKNDRGGDLMLSLKAISSLIDKKYKIIIFLSELNDSFDFLFKNLNIKKIGYNISIYEKIKLFYFLLTNKVDEIYILSPKNYYYYLAFIFRKIKFYALVIDGKKRKRPPNFLRKYLHKYQVINRKDALNLETSEQKQLNLVDGNIPFDREKFKQLTIPNVSSYFYDLIPKNYIFFQYKEIFFKKINWNLANLDDFFNLLLLKNENVVFCSDLNQNNYNRNFLSKYAFIDFNETVLKKRNEGHKVLYLHDINAEDLFQAVGLSSKVVCPHGLISQMSKFHKKSTLALFNFEIKSKSDYLHQKISFSEWYGPKCFDFAFLNNNFNKSLRKISTRI